MIIGQLGCKNQQQALLLVELTAQFKVQKEAVKLKDLRRALRKEL
jgi:hypothetical protein